MYVFFKAYYTLLSAGGVQYIGELVIAFMDECFIDLYL